MSYWGFPEYVSVAEKKARAAKKLKELLKKRPDLKPVILEGKALARTWWGKAWNGNLERYADYDNRIGRGRSYLRHGAVLHLHIDEGEVKSLVQGSERSPYSVEIRISALQTDVWQSMINACEGALESLQHLINGAFPKPLGEIFMAKGSGMFPSPKEIKFSCSCPDSAYMCKHVAAVLYGIGSRLDEDVSLFFKLRRANMDELVRRAVSVTSEKILKRAGKKSARIINDADLGAVFGIEIEAPVLPSRKEKQRSKAGIKHLADDTKAVPGKSSVKPRKPAKAKPVLKVKPPAKTIKKKVKKAAVKKI